ncbi:MAG: Fe-S cluster assembly protein SufD [Marinilabiliales bacterium]
MFENKTDLFTSDFPAYVVDLKKEAIENFRKNGFPTKANENYRYTDICKLFQNDFIKFPREEDYALEIRDIFQCNVPELDTHLILTINGNYFNNNDKSDLPEGVIIKSMKQAFNDHPELIKEHFNKYVAGNKDSLTDLNLAYFRDGFFIYIPENIRPDKALQIVNILRADENRVIQQRNLIIAEKNSEFKIIICDHTLSEHKYLTNNVTEIYTGENAILDIYNIQDEHDMAWKNNQLFIQQEYNSNFLSHIITLHGGIVRNSVFAKLNNQGCTNQTYGIFFADNEQHIDNYSLIDHNAPNCNSNELFKGILDDNATASFSGKILVRKDSQKTEAYQANNNILLTDDAKINTKPQLEIYADDVKCSHGATIGQLDKDAMFYLRSRGIDYKEARMMLMFAFANEVINKIRVLPLQDRINDLVEKRLRGELTRCVNCNVKCIKNN